MDSDSELLMAVTPRSRRKESIVNNPTCISYLDLEVNGRKENIPYMITHDKTFPSTFNITFTGAIGQQRKRKIKEEWCRNHPKVQLVDTYLDIQGDQVYCDIIVWDDQCITWETNVHDWYPDCSMTKRGINGGKQIQVASGDGHFLSFSIYTKGKIMIQGPSSNIVNFLSTNRSRYISDQSTSNASLVQEPTTREFEICEDTGVKVPIETLFNVDNTGVTHSKQRDDIDDSSVVADLGDDHDVGLHQSVNDTVVTHSTPIRSISVSSKKRLLKKSTRASAQRIKDLEEITDNLEEAVVHLSMNNDSLFHKIKEEFTVLVDNIMKKYMSNLNHQFITSTCQVSEHTTPTVRRDVSVQTERSGLCNKETQSESVHMINTDCQTNQDENFIQSTSDINNNYTPESATVTTCPDMSVTCRCKTESVPHENDAVSMVSESPGDKSTHSWRHHNTSETKRHKGSSFRASSFKIEDHSCLPELVTDFTRSPDYDRAKHNIVAYSIQGEYGYDDDDGEHGAGEHMCDLLRDCNLHNIVLIVSRWYDGAHIGPIRHQLMRDCATEAIDGISFTRISDEEWSLVKRRKGRTIRATNQRAEIPRSKSILLLTSSVGQNLRPQSLAKADINQTSKYRTLTISQVKAVMSDLDERCSYAHVVIMVGSNDLADMTSPCELQSVQDNYTDMVNIVREKQPSATIHIIQLLPRKDVHIDRIIRFNNFLSSIQGVKSVQVNRL